MLKDGNRLINIASLAKLLVGFPKETLVRLKCDFLHLDLLFRPYNVVVWAWCSNLELSNPERSSLRKVLIDSDVQGVLLESILLQIEGSRFAKACSWVQSDPLECLCDI